MTTRWLNGKPILIFDSGLGGLTVYREVAAARPDADFLYVADDAAFPYGALAEPALIARRRTHGRPHRDAPPGSRGHRLQYRLDHRAPGVAQEICGAVRRHGAGDQAGLRRLGHQARVRARHRGDGQARIYPRAHSRLCARLRSNAGRPPTLAAYAEAELDGAPVGDAEMRAEIAPCFRDDGKRTDTVVLACTHYPLLLDRLRQLAPWPVNFHRSGAGDCAASGRSARAIVGGRRHGDDARHFHLRPRTSSGSAAFRLARQAASAARWAR